MMGILLGLLAGSASALMVAAMVPSSVLSRIDDRSDRRPTGLRLPVRSAALAGGLLAGMVGLVLLGPVAGAISAVSAVVVPRVLRRRRAAGRAEKLEGQLADGVSAMAAGMRAGLSLSQAIGFASSELGPPLSDDLAAIVDREAMGMPLGASIDTWVRGEEGADFRLTASVLQLHRRSGGDLPSVLDRVARTLSERRAATREASSLTAQARLSGAILGFLPIGFFLFLTLLSPKDMAAAYRSPAGVAAIASGFAMQGAAFIWIRSLLKVGV